MSDPPVARRGLVDAHVVRTIMVALCILTAVAVVSRILRSGTAGGDYIAYCGSVRAVQAGLDPYYAENTGHPLILSYPVGLLVLLSPPCLRPSTLYPVFYTVLLGVAGAGLWRIWPGQALLTVALLLGGLAAIPYNFLTGNIGIVEMVCLVAALGALSREQHGRAGLWMGLVSAAKLSPFAFAVVFGATLWRGRTVRDLFRFGLGVMGGFAILHGLSLLISPRYEYSLFLVLTGAIAGGPLPEMHGNWTNPALPLILKDMLAALGAPSAIALVVYGAALLVGGWLFLTWWRRERDEMTLLCYGILLVCLLLPRFKPYSFTYAVVPLIYLLRRQGPGTQALGVLVGGILPLLAYRYPLDGLVVSAWLKVPLSSIQYGFTLATFVLLVLADRARWWKPAHDGAGRTVSVGVGV